MKNMIDAQRSTGICVPESLQFALTCAYGLLTLSTQLMIYHEVSYTKQGSENITLWPRFSFIIYCFTETTRSTRRFVARPAAVSLEEIGCASPKPAY